MLVVDALNVRAAAFYESVGFHPLPKSLRLVLPMRSIEEAARAMSNARQGFWNGALPPIGYRIVAAEQRGARIKKKLEIDPIHADTVRLIYRLALKGEGDSGPMGIKSITNHLNARNIRTRDGGKFGIASVHQILTRTTYIGQHRFNTRDHKTRNAKPEAEHAVMDVPPIITEAEFEAVRAALKARSPQWMPPRAVSGPTLLTGICFCASCGGAMTLWTGKGSQYRYYTCSTKARQGKSGCSGLNRIIRSHFICTNCGSENVFMLGVSPGDFQGDGLTLVLPKWKLSFSNLFVTELAAAALL